MIYSLIALALGIPLSLLRGLVLSDLVRWFTPYNISVVQAIGLTLIVSLFIMHIPGRSDQIDDKAEKIASMVVYSVTGSLLVWGVAYLWHLFL